MKIVDCTIGGGGHARMILELITPGGMLIGVDRDEEALKAASARLSDFKDNLHLVNSDFRELPKILKKEDVGKIDGFLFDLGLSSLQLEEERRGFSIKHNGPLD